MVENKGKDLLLPVLKCKTSHLVTPCKNWEKLPLGIVHRPFVDDWHRLQTVNVRALYYKYCASNLQNISNSKWV